MSNPISSAIFILIAAGITGFLVTNFLTNGIDLSQLGIFTMILEKFCTTTNDINSGNNCKVALMGMILLTIILPIASLFKSISTFKDPKIGFFLHIIGFVFGFIIMKL